MFPPIGKGVKKMRKRFVLGLAIVALAALAVVGTAGAVTVPAIPVSDYGDSLLSSLATAIAAVLPYAAAITAFAIGVGMLKRWLGHRKATRI
jgi:multisubunit Na+/H+ antiporter MnhC subunit